MPRLVRSVLLGAVAAALGIWWLGRAYGIEAAELLGFVFGSIAFVAVSIALAGAVAAAAFWLRRRIRRARNAGDAGDAGNG